MDETPTPEQPAEISTPLAKAILDRLFAIEDTLVRIAQHGPVAAQLERQASEIVAVRCAVEQLRKEIGQQQRVARAAVELHLGDPSRPGRA